MTDKVTTEKLNKNRLTLNNNIKSTLEKIISQKNFINDPKQNSQSQNN